MAQGRFDPSFQPNGLQYHYAIWEDTVYVCRNEGALLWHCGDGIGADSYNYTAIGVHVPTTKGFPVSKRTVQTLAEFVANKLDQQGATSRVNVKGHQEVGASECPGPLMGQFVMPFRAGYLNRGEDPGGQTGGEIRAVNQATGGTPEWVRRPLAFLEATRGQVRHLDGGYGRGRGWASRLGEQRTVSMISARRATAVFLASLGA